MTILIVDDEASTLYGITKIIDWEKLLIEKVFTASNMNEALSLFKQFEVDILLTDIQMKNGTGLDLIAKIRDQYPKCINLILSSYPDFRFAQQAISLGVFEYLLKPVDDFELETVLVKAISESKKLHSHNEKTEIPVNDPLVHSVQDYIVNNISQEITRDEIAKHINLSPDYLSKYFKKKVGLSLSDYIKNQRMSIAQSMLAHTNLPINIIAENSGFNTLSYFSYAFRQATGISPSQYRNNTDKYTEN